MFLLRNARDLFQSAKHRKRDSDFLKFLITYRTYNTERMIKTLDPTKLQPSDCLDLAGVREPTILTPHASFTIRYESLLEKPKSSRRIRTPFPCATRGFLYMVLPGNEPQPKWQIRFRITGSDSPESFESGTDLLRSTRKLWSVEKLGKRALSSLQELLRQDDLMSDALVSAYSVLLLIPFIKRQIYKSNSRPKYIRQIIQTLDPSRLLSSDYLDLRGLQAPVIRTQESRTKLTYTQQGLGRTRTPFPHYTRGFLYLHAATLKIRFRVTDSDSPLSFDSGVDLLRPNEAPWTISSTRLPIVVDVVSPDGLSVDAVDERAA